MSTKKHIKKANVTAARHSLRTWTAWGVRWESKNCLDGEQKHLVGSANVSIVSELRGCTGALMFETRRACREYIKQKWGYIRNRKDLRTEPHGWRMPKAVKIEVQVQEANCKQRFIVEP